MKRFLWYILVDLFEIAIADFGFRNNHFAAVASDQPALEVFTPLISLTKL